MGKVTRSDESSRPGWIQRTTSPGSKYVIRGSFLGYRRAVRAAWCRARRTPSHTGARGTVETRRGIRCPFLCYVRGFSGTWGKLLHELWNASEFGLIGNDETSADNSP